MTTNHARPLRICLAASGGGHLRQLLDLQPIWSEYDSFFVTESTALGESLSKYRKYFVTHVAVGQARLGRPWLMMRSAWRNFWQCGSAIRAERPDVVISTGAGAVFSTILWGRLTGATVIAIESFARFEKPSLFMRLAAPLAHHKIVQSGKLAGWWRDALVFDPLRFFDDTGRDAKQPLLFATVGATLPFDRMILAVAELKERGEISERVIAQVGVDGAKPACLEAVETMPFEQMQETLKAADIVVCHGGTGSLITALRERCRTIAMPRLFKRGEHYDDHQEEIVSSFADRGLVLRADDVEGLRRALLKARTLKPVGATTDPRALSAWLKSLLSDLAAQR